MKKLIGKDIGSYYFKPGWRMVIIEEIEYDLEQVLLITNVTSNIVIYNFADPTLGGYIYVHPEFGKGIKLDYDSTAMISTDRLQIWIDIPTDDLQPLRDFNSHDLKELLDNVLIELKTQSYLLEYGLRGYNNPKLLDNERIRLDITNRKIKEK